MEIPRATALNITTLTILTFLAVLPIAAWVSNRVGLWLIGRTGNDVASRSRSRSACRIDAASPYRTSGIAAHRIANCTTSSSNTSSATGNAGQPRRRKTASSTRSTAWSLS
jgi:hypothetical protein